MIRLHRTHDGTYEVTHGGSRWMVNRRAGTKRTEPYWYLYRDCVLVTDGCAWFPTLRAVRTHIEQATSA